MKTFHPFPGFLAAGIGAILALISGACGVFDGDIHGADAVELILPDQTVIPVQMVQAAGRRAILIRGNDWVAGLPGFPDNAFAALYGEYRLEFPGEAAGTGSAGTDAGAFRIAALSAGKGPPDFYAWLSRERLYFLEDIWETRAGITGYPAQQRNMGDSLLVAVEIDGGKDRDAWTALFQFPQSAGTMFGAGDLNLLIRSWILRFRYFLSLAAMPADISLPAVVNF
jgi:hypothetical protein